ncbi:hypothetical protein DPMN_189791 [Dreissena polymorpha]|uniref:Uncharacterized protein n=1 Tax=Dreissena polymorpha TaxID=45954 RepID=A0A9D4DTF3_DREPO|nr:hypothetical protein DPMN_189791 [Dreissena polymorpha]
MKTKVFRIPVHGHSHFSRWERSEARKLQDMFKYCAVTVDNISAIFVFVDHVTYAKHGCQHSVGVFGERGKCGGEVGPAHI